MANNKFVYVPGSKLSDFTAAHITGATAADAYFEKISFLENGGIATHGKVWANPLSIRETADNYSAGVKLATADSIGKIIYLSADETVGSGDDAVTYSKGLYIVSGEATLSKLGTTSASGDIASDVELLKGKVETIEGRVAVYDGEATVAGSIAEAKKAGDDAMDEAKAKIASVQKAADSGDYAAVYEFVDGDGKTLDVKINIPKDMVVSSGEIVNGDTSTTDHPLADHKYLKLVLANADKSELYIDVDTLVDKFDGNNIVVEAVAADPTHVAIAGGVLNTVVSNVSAAIKSAHDDAYAYTEAKIAALDMVHTTVADLSSDFITVSTNTDTKVVTISDAGLVQKYANDVTNLLLGDESVAGSVKEAYLHGTNAAAEAQANAYAYVDASLAWETYGEA